MNLVLFDLDGTIVDSQDTIVASMAAGFRAGGLEPLTRTEVLSITGMSLPVGVRHLLGPHAPQELVDTVTGGYRAYYQSVRDLPEHQPPLFPGARDALDALAARDDLLLGIVTGKGRRGLEAVLRFAGLRERFVTTWTADDAMSKPHPEMVLNAMAEVGALPQRTVVVGDAVFDMEMARTAGATPIAVSWGYHTVDQLVAAGAKAVLASYGELVPTVDRIFEAVAA